MKRFFITTLLCATALSECETIKEKALSNGFSENWDESATDLVLNNGLIINKNHVPKYYFLDPKTRVFAPVPARDFLKNPYDVLFETNGEFEECIYCEPESKKDSSRELWLIVETLSGNKYTVPAARLLIPEEDLLKAAGYVKNWKDRKENLTVGTPYGYCSIDKSHVPALKRLNKGTEIYFPVPARDYLNNKEDIDFVTNGKFKHGRYCSQEIDKTKRILWSIVEDDNGNFYTVPTVRLMINHLLLRSITSPFKETI